MGAGVGAAHLSKYWASIFQVAVKQYDDMWMCVAYLHLPVFLSQIRETVATAGVCWLSFFTEASHPRALRLDILLEAQEYSVERSLKCLKLLNISEPVLKAALG